MKLTSTLILATATRGSPAQRNGLASTVAIDQRGAPRHAKADAGAFELIEPELSVTVAAVPVVEGGTLAFGSTPFDIPIAAAVTITNSQASPFTTGPLAVGNVSVPAGYAITGFPGGLLDNGQSATFNVILMGTNTGLFNAALTFTGNDSFMPNRATADSGFSNRHLINLAGLVTDTANHWRQQNFGPGVTNAGDAADDANPSGDGIVNLLKYSLGLNPQVAYPPGVVVATGLDPAGRLTMTVTRNPAATDVTLTIEVSGDLAAPSSWNAAGTTIDQNTPTTLQAHDNTPISAAQNRFIRLKVTQP